ncbi:MAG: SGNH/GDSL hydrolase family protein [Candidatus Latescibacteria bacterium]|jgi:lysophospholipase L1-like esterase|nr:SGNH/GDSL hydrolase family protein [Candidatus Latescibacterota bacterium]
MRVFSFGASTAQGAKDDVGGGFIGRLGKRLEREQLGTAENYGIGGENTTQMVQRLDGVPDVSLTDVAIVTLGINDVPRYPDARPERRVKFEKHKSNVREIMTYLQMRCKVIYASQYPVQYMQLGFNPETVADYRKAGVAIAEELELDVLDVFALIDDEKFARFIHADGMHFNSEGHQFIADALWHYMQDHADV